MPRKDGFEQFTLPDDPEGAPQGRRFWRSLQDLAETPEFREAVEREFPHGASEWTDETSRRDFLKIMGASLALAGLNGCRVEPADKIVPYVNMPEEVIPGKPLFYATAVPLGGFGTGILVESHMSRPTRITGNEQHPASLGATGPFEQAAVLDLYDPDRSQVVVRDGAISSWAAFHNALSSRMRVERGRDGSGLRILTETISSPTLAQQVRQLREQYPQARWHQYEPVNRDNARRGAIMAFGEDVHTIYHPERADVILALDSDFLTTGPGHVRYAREFAARRRVIPPGGPLEEGREGFYPQMNRLYTVESTRTSTGSMADHRLVLSPTQIEPIARTVAARLGIDVDPARSEELTGVPEGWIDALVDDLRNYRLEGRRGAALVVAGTTQPPVVHALAHAMNETLGAGQSVTYTEPVVAEPVDETESLRELVDDMQAGQVETLVILGGNPAFTAPADVPFADALREVGFTAHLARYENETSALCRWHLPQAHFLETWGDVRTYNGLATIMQPLIRPLYQGRSAHEVLSAMMGRPDRAPYDMVREYWRNQLQAEDFEDAWRTALHDGIVAGTEFPPKEVSVQQPFSQAVQAAAAQPTPAAEQGFAIVFRPDPTIWDGRFANNGWLQELPKPFTKLSWDNAALMSPHTAERLGLQEDEMVEIAHGDRTIEMPVWKLPGQAEDVITLHFGYGRSRMGRIGTGAGFNVYPLRTTGAMWFATDVEVRRIPRRYQLVSTQDHHRMHDRHIVRAGTLQAFREHPEHPPFVEVEHAVHGHPTLYPEWEYPQYKWGMSIDLNTCLGCNACVIACQSENNIPVVGKEQVGLGREMHWLRIDSYYEGPVENPKTYHQPMLCQHCEHAPCEPVCPVAATTHSDSGLNEMTYNRCVGTRYCSNNCPYKVRRFNFLEYNEDKEEFPVLQMMQNPDVTVRSRGVMEKCTYCVQRINAARIEAKKESREIRPGEVVTACQAACPTQSIVFGDLNKPESEVSRRKHQPLDYEVLGDLGTRPRTTYSAHLRNPNPKLEHV